MARSEQLHHTFGGETTTDVTARGGQRWPWIASDGRILALAAACGTAFGFLLQKGGVAKFDILIGVLLLQNFVVLKVMLSAIIVGALCFHLLARRGWVEHKIKPARYGDNALGGVIFGVGFAQLAYCPGTDAAAIGQGNYDALVGVAGMIFGSYLYALSTRSARSPALGRDRGELTIPQLLGLGQGLSIALVVGALTLVLVAIEWLAA